MLHKHKLFLDSYPHISPWNKKSRKEKIEGSIGVGLGVAAASLLVYNQYKAEKRDKEAYEKLKRDHEEEFNRFNAYKTHTACDTIQDENDKKACHRHMNVKYAVRYQFERKPKNIK